MHTCTGTQLYVCSGGGSFLDIKGSKLIGVTDTKQEIKRKCKLENVKRCSYEMKGYAWLRRRGSVERSIIMFLA